MSCYQTGWIIFVIFRINAKVRSCRFNPSIDRSSDSSGSCCSYSVHMQKYVRVLFACSRAIISTLTSTILSTRETEAAVGGNLCWDFGVRKPIIRLRLTLFEIWPLRIAKSQLSVGPKGVRTVGAFGVCRDFLKAQCRVLGAACACRN